MAIVTITYDEFLQFVCWTAYPDDAQCEGLNGYFAALRITDVQIIQGTSFLFDPQLIFALSAGSTQFADPALWPNNPENYATVLIGSSGSVQFSFPQSGMLLVRDVYVKGHEVPEPGVPVGPPVGAPTAWGYESNSDTVFFESTGSVPVPAQNEVSSL